MLSKGVSDIRCQHNVDFQISFVYNIFVSMDKKHKKNEYLENWKRERAAFLNYKKEEGERMERVIKFANQELILNILDILDNIYIAEEKLPKDLKGDEWVKGILNIKSQILEFLKNQGVEEIKCLKKEFDPNFHEAVEMAESDSKPGIIIKEIKKGYILNGRVIRPAKVKIAK